MKNTFRKLDSWANRHEFVFFLLFFALLLRLPTLFEPFWYGDENIYLAIGDGIRKGLVLYQGITDFPNKPPAIYLLAAIVRGVFGFRLVLLIWTLFGTATFFYLSRLISGRNKLSLIATIIFIFLTSTPILEGTITNSEIFFIAPVMASAYLLWRAFIKPKTKHPHKLAFISGLLLGLAFLFKIHVALDIVAFGLFFFVFSRLKNLKIKNITRLFTFKPAYFYILGTVIPIVAILIIWALIGVSPGALFQNAAGSTGYVAVFGSKDYLLQTIGFGSLLSRTVLLSIITLLLFFVRNKIRPSILFVSLWLVFDLYAALLSGRPYPHYLIQIIPPTVLISVLFIRHKQIVSRSILIFCLALIVASFLRFEFRLWPVLSYYKNFISYTSGTIDRWEFYRRFDSRMPRNYVLSEYLHMITSKNESIFVWGTEPELYVLSDRLPVGTLTTSFHVDDLKYYDHIIDLLIKNKTKVIVVMETEHRNFPALTALLNTDYTLIQTIGDPDRTFEQNLGRNALVYRRIQ